MHMEVTRTTSVMPSAPRATNEGPRLSSSGLSWEPLMSTGMRAIMAMSRMRMRSKKHRKPMMDQCRMWRTRGIVFGSVKIGKYISDLWNTIMAKPMQRPAMYPKRRLYCNQQQHLKAKHICGECGIRDIAIEERYNVALRRRKTYPSRGIVQMGTASLEPLRRV